MPINLGDIVRPTTVTIFASDPTSSNKALAFILSQTQIPLPGQVQMHLTQSVQAQKRYTVTRNPLEKAVAENIQPQNETLQIQCQLSANPLGKGVTSNATAQLGAFGSIIRLDLLELDKLRQLADKREPLLVVTPPRVYKNMALVGIDERHTGAHKVDLSLSFETMRIVSPIIEPDVFDQGSIGILTVENAGVQSPILL